MHTPSPWLISTHPTRAPSPVVISTQNTHAISMADQHPHNAHSISMDDSLPPNALMSPLLGNPHAASTHVSTSGQHTPMSPLLASTHVSISGQQAPTKATAVLLPAVGCPRVVPRNWLSYKSVVGAGASLL